nr:trem-like transcript 2 protein isoform X1 [Loxodonta africana]
MGKAVSPLDWGSLRGGLCLPLRLNSSTAEQYQCSRLSPPVFGFRMPHSSSLTRPCSTRHVSLGPLAENTYTKVQHWEGETLSVQCPYKNRKNHLEGKVWCRVRRKKCEAGFTRVWAQEPHYLLQDDAQAKVVTITMAALRPQDSGRYWCMRNSSRTLYPLMGILLEVFPAPTTERNTPLTHLSNILKGGMVLATGRTPTSGSDAPFNTSMTLFTAGLLTVASILPSTAPGTIGPTPMVGHSFTGTTPTTTGGRTTMGSQTVTESPSSAQTSSVGQVPISTKSVPPSTRLPTTGTCHTRKALLNKLPPIRHQDSDPTVLAVVLALLPVPVLLVIFYGLWKRRHTGSEYSPPPSQSAGPWGFTYFLRRLPALCL